MQLTFSSFSLSREKLENVNCMCHSITVYLPGTIKVVCTVSATVS